MNMAAVHPVCPSNIIGKYGKYAVDLSRIEAAVDASDDLDIIFRHIVSSR
jgi:hypothetical protein